MRVRPTSLVIPAVLAAGILSAACGGGDASAPAADTPAAAAGSPVSPQRPKQTWTAVSDSIDAEFATPDLAPGRQRIAMVLSDDRGLIRLPVTQVRSFRYLDGFASGKRDGPLQTATARFHEFPLGTRGIYVAELDFIAAGDWSIEVETPRPDGSVSTVEIRFPVAARTKSVAVGERPPASPNKTLADVPSIARLTTGSHRDPELYRIKIEDALTSGKPTVVVFASPAFCTNAVCGPQVEVLSEVRERYGSKANYVHVDYYDNPHEIQGDLSRAVVSPVLAEWGLESQEWTFVIGKDGRVSARFENFAPRDELEAALDAALAAS